MMLSVIIATYNRAHYLLNCLRTLEEQRLDNNIFEIVVINDGSTDTTKEVLENFKLTTQLQFRCYHFENAGVSTARNRGISLAKYDFIAFTDDDCILPPDWLDRVIRSWKNTDDSIAGIGGPLNTVTLGMPTFTSRFIHYLDEFNYIPVLTNWYIKPIHVSSLTGHEIVPYLRTSNVSFRKKCLIQVGGFDETFQLPGGEDPDLCYRLLACGYKLYFNKNIVVNHLSRVSLTSYFKSLHNYVLGDFRKSDKRWQYPEAVARCYRLIFAQKVASFVLELIILPLTVIRLIASHQTKSILFPIIILSAKLYALLIACMCLLHKFRN